MIPNFEDKLDSLLDDMNDDELARYDAMWDQLLPWRKAYNWTVRLTLLLLVIATLAQGQFWIRVALFLGGVLVPGGAALFTRIQMQCHAQARQVLHRMNQNA